MESVSSKVTSIVLSAVLCFWMAFPVSAFVKPERAEANPAIAIPVIFGTALAAGGVFVAGSSLSQYNANLQSVYDGFSHATSQWSQSWGEYVSAQGSFNQAMSSCVTADGTISLQTLTDAGFFDSLNSYSAYCVQQGTMAAGDSSRIVHSYEVLGGYKFDRNWMGYPGVYGQTAVVAAIAEIAQEGYTNFVGYEFYNTPINIGYKSYPQNVQLFFYSSDTITPSTSTWYDVPYMKLSGKRIIVGYSDSEIATTTDNGSLSWNSYENPHYADRYGANRYVCVNPSINIDLSGLSTLEYEDESKVAAVGSGVADTSATVQPFEPTAEQLATGFDSSAIVDAINSGNAQTNAGINEVISTLTGTIGGVLNDIKTGINGLETAIGTAINAGAASVVSGVSSAISTGVNTLSTVLNDIRTASQTIEQTLGGAISTTLTGIATGIAGVGTTLGDIWGDLQGWYTDWLAWVGTTPLGALIAQVIAALNAGVLDLAGLLELVNAGVLDLSTAIELVQTAVQDGVAEITGAIEGIQFPSFEWPKVEGSPQVALTPGDMRSSMDAVIQDKAPFAYMYTFGEGIQSLEYSSEPKFRMRHTFDIVADEVEIDINAEPWLNRDIGGVTIAQLLRASVTLTLCMGLLYGAYKTALAAVKAG